MVNFSVRRDSADLVMKFRKWKVAALLFLMIRAHHALLSFSEDRTTQQNSCIAVISQSYIRSLSNIAILTIQSNDQQRSLSVDSIRHDSLLRQVGLNETFSFIIIELTIRDRDCICPRKLKNPGPVDYFLIIGSSLELVNCIRRFCFARLVSDQSKFVVYLETIHSDAGSEVNNVLEILWRRQRQNVLILLANHQGDIHIYEGISGSEMPRLDILAKCERQHLRDTSSRILYKPRNPDGVVIKIGVVDAPPYVCNRIGGGFTGTDIEIIEAMASALNLSLVYIPAQNLRRANESEGVAWKGYYGAWKNVLLGLLAGEVDVGIGGYALTTKVAKQLGYTQPYLYDTTQFYATIDLISSHDMEECILWVIMLMFLVHICMSMAMHLLERRVNRRKRDFGATAIMVWSILTDLSADLTNLSRRQLLLWTVCAFFAINMNTAYKSYLASVLASPLYVERIQTVDDMIDSGIPFLKGSPFPPSGSGVVSPEEQAILWSRISYCRESLHRCLVAHLSTGHYGLSAYSLEMEFVQSSLPNRLLHPLDRTIQVLYIGIYTTKNFFLTRKMTMLLHRLAQAGLIDFWYKKNLRNNLCDIDDPSWWLLQSAGVNNSHLEKYHANATNPLTMAHLYPHFKLLWLGLTVAGVVFCIEYISARRAIIRRGRALEPVAHELSFLAH